MCNIAGYVGLQSAVPILIEMMRREEGGGGGFYIGMATIHEGTIYYAKVVGTLDDLLKNTNAASFPSTTGGIHSRSHQRSNSYDGRSPVLRTLCIHPAAYAHCSRV